MGDKLTIFRILVTIYKNVQIAGENLTYRSFNFWSKNVLIKKLPNEYIILGAKKNITEP